MELEKLVSIAKQKKTGTFQTIVYHRTAKTYGATKGGEKAHVEKTTTFQALRRTNYSNRFFVKLGTVLGLRKPPKLPEWARAKWVDGIRLIEHVRKGTVYLPANTEGMRVQVQWYLDGKKSTYSEVEPFLLEEERKEKATKEKLARKWQAPHVRLNINNIVHLS